MTRYKHKSIFNLKRNLLSVTAISVLAGCSIAPKNTEAELYINQSYLYQPVVVSNTQNNEETGDISAALKGTVSLIKPDKQPPRHWWYAFDDTILNTLITDAQQQNITLKVASQRIKTAQSYQKVVESFKLPTVSIGAGYSDFQLSENDPLLGTAVSPISMPAQLQPMLGESLTIMDKHQQSQFVGANIAWEADLFGRIENKANAAKLRAEQVKTYRTGLTTLITADVIHNYIQYRGAQERKHIALQTITDQQQALTIVSSMVDSGFGSELNRAQAQAYLAMLESLIPQIEIAEQVHKQRLAILLGETLPKVEHRLNSGSGSGSGSNHYNSHVVPEFSAMIPTGLPSDLLKRRPDLQIAEQQIAIKDADVAAAIANKYPKFFFTGTPGLVAGNFDDLFSHNSLSWLASVGVSWNIFDAGRSDALVEIEQSTLKSAVMQYQQSVNSAIIEVNSALYIYGRSQENLINIKQAKHSTNHALEKANALYKAGLIDYLSVLDAQRQFNLMREHTLSARLQTAQVTVSLHKALGGDWLIKSSKS